MLVVMQQGATEAQIQAVIDRLVELGFDVHRSTGVIHTVLGGVGGKDDFDLAVFEVMEGVKEAHRIVSPYKLASRSFRPAGTVVQVGIARDRRRAVVVMAGPCSVENPGPDRAVRRDRRPHRRPRHSRRRLQAAQFALQFQGLGEEGLKMLRDAADRHGLLVVSEVMDQTQIPLLRRVRPTSSRSARATCRTSTCCANSASSPSPCCSSAASPPPSRSCCSRPNTSWPAATTTSFSASAASAPSKPTRATPWIISAIPVVKKLSHLPIVADPSHGTGRRDKVAPMARAAVAAGADGLLIEVHPDPDHALSDGAQSLRPEQFEELMAQLQPSPRP